MLSLILIDSSVVFANKRNVHYSDLGSLVSASVSWPGVLQLYWTSRYCGVPGQEEGKNCEWTSTWHRDRFLHLWINLEWNLTHVILSRPCRLKLFLVRAFYTALFWSRFYFFFIVVEFANKFLEFFLWIQELNKPAATNSLALACKKRRRDTYLWGCLW